MNARAEEPQETSAVKGLQLFTEAQHGWKLRKLIIPDGRQVIAVNDVSDSLHIANSREIKDRLDPEGVFTISKASTSSAGLGDIDFGDPRINEMTFIDVENVMLLVFQSRKPEAVVFSKWVRREVLASVFKTGSYTMPGAKNQPQEVTPEMTYQKSYAIHQVGGWRQKEVMV